MHQDSVRKAGEEGSCQVRDVRVMHPVAMTKKSVWTVLGTDWYFRNLTPFDNEAAVYKHLWLSLQLDYKVDDKMLRDVFKIAGKVVTVEISKDQDGKSRGFGVVGKLRKFTSSLIFKSDFCYMLTCVHVHWLRKDMYNLYNPENNINRSTEIIIRHCCFTNLLCSYTKECMYQGLYSRESFLTRHLALTF